VPQQQGRVHALWCAMPGLLDIGRTGALRVMLTCARILVRALDMQGWGMPTHGVYAAGMSTRGFRLSNVPPARARPYALTARSANRMWLAGGARSSVAGGARPSVTDACPAPGG
jgi:hypothetical protein